MKRTENEIKLHKQLTIMQQECIARIKTIQECREYFHDGFDIDLENTFRQFIGDINKICLLYRMEKKNKTHKIWQK